MVRFSLATTLLASFAATSAAFQPINNRVNPPNQPGASIAANDMIPTQPVTPPPKDDKPKPKMEIDMKS